MQRLLKFLHSISAIGLTGGLLTYILVLQAVPREATFADYAVVRISLDYVSNWLIVPSMVIALASGLLAIAATRIFMNATWAWIKAVSGVLIFESTLGAIDAPSQRAANAAWKILEGDTDPALIATLMEAEWTAWWIILGLCVANVILGIWRPRFRGKKAPQSKKM